MCTQRPHLRPKNLTAAHYEADASNGARQNPQGLHAVTGEGLLEYSLRLSQQVTSLEAQNLELRDARDAALSSHRRSFERVEVLERENQNLRQAQLVTYQEGKLAVRRAGDAVVAGQGEVMLLRHEAGKRSEHAEALTAHNARLEGIAARLQGERRQLHEHLLGWEATASALQAEMAEQASAKADADRAHGDLKCRARLLFAEKRRADEQAGEHHVVLAQLQLAREELAAERDRSSQLRDELSASVRDAAATRAEVNAAALQGEALLGEVLRWRHAEGVAAAAQPALHGALQHQGATAANFRSRVGELESTVTRLQRELTRLEAENGAVRAEWRAAHADAQRFLEDSAELASQKHKAEQDAGSQERGRIVAQHHLTVLASDASQLHWHREALRDENTKLWAEVRRLEAENIILRSRVKGQEVILQR